MPRVPPIRRGASPIAALLLATLAAAGCGGEPAGEAPGASADATEPAESAESGGAPSFGLDADALAGLLLERMDLRPGERVLLVARPGRFDPLVEEVRAGVRAAGAEDLGVAAAGGSTPPAAWGTGFTERLAGLEGSALVDALRDVDLGVMMPGAAGSDPVYAGMQDVLRGGEGRTIHFHWAGAYGLDSNELPVTPEVDAFYQRVLLETDYEALARSQAAFEEAMRGSTVRVTTPAGTDLSFRIGDRPVTKQDGDASAARAAEARNLIDREVELPAGAVRVAPLEETVQGTIAFPPTEWLGEPVEGLVMTFEDGVATEVEADRGLDAVTTVLDEVGTPARSFRELAVGFNPLMPVQRDAGTPWIPYYGYGDGVVRLSLGDNSELGGDVGGGWLRWNFFTDATVTVDGETWVDGGRLVR